VAINDEYPMILEYLILVSPEQGDTILILPETHQAPHLRHLLLFGFSLPTGPNKISITHDCRGPRHNLSYHCPPIHLLPSEYSAPMDFIHATAGNRRLRLYVPHFQS